MTMANASRPWWRNKIAYQIYPKSFLDGNGDGIGDLPGVLSKLDYLKDLGVDILWLSPVYPSPMVDQGYDISDYYGIDPCFGTMEDLEALIRELKRREMYLVMDLVVSHCSDQHPWFREAVRDPAGKYGQYFYLKPGRNGGPPNNWRAEFGGSCWERLPGSDLYYFHTFAKEQPDLNWENPEVRREICDMVNWWLDKGVSGFRLDAIINLKKDLRFQDGPADSPDGTCAVSKMLPRTAEIGAFLNQLKRECFLPHDAFTVGEVYSITPERVAEFGGPEGYFSTLFDFGHFLAGHQGPFWYQYKPFDFKTWRDAIFQAQENAGSAVFLANVLENHDRPRAPGIFLPEGDACYESVTALAALSVLLRGIPFLYQGQEIGMRNGDFRTVEDFEDLNTHDQYQAARSAGRTEAEAMAVCRRHSRDNARTPMQWTGGKHAGFTSGTPWFPVNPNYRELNAEADAAAGERSVRGWYKRLLALRKAPEWEDVLVHGGFCPAFREEPEIFAYWRTGETSGERVLVLCHYGRGQASVPFPEPFRVLLNNYDGLENREGRLWLRTYQIVVLACGAGEQEAL